MHRQVKMKKEKGKNEETFSIAHGSLGEVGEKIWNIRDRSFAFAVRIVKLCQYLEKPDLISRTLVRQLLRSATSVGANLEEGQAGQSKPDFISKNAIALIEARESNYWLRLFLASYEFESQIRAGVEELRDESREIALIIGAIIVSSKR